MDRPYVIVEFPNEKKEEEERYRPHLIVVAEPSREWGLPVILSTHARRRRINLGQARTIVGSSLKEVMRALAGTPPAERVAIKNIIGGLITKSVQEAYSAAGRPGANGITKKSLSATIIYDSMKDVILNILDGKTSTSKILTATSWYLSGAGDREGGKKLRDKKNE